MAFNQERLEENAGLGAVTAQVEGSVFENQQAQVYLFPAGLEQSRYWILNQLENNSTASNMAISFRLEGGVHDELVEQAIYALSLRHEALRTNFRMLDSELLQVISEEPRYRFSICDLRDGTPDAQQKAVALIEEHGRVTIDLAEGAVLYVRLIHVSEHEHFLALTVHHIACDGWSNGILVRDFAEFYAALKERRSAALPELPFQFADFTVWQHKWLASEAAQAAIDFWRSNIRREVPALNIATDRPRSAKTTAPGCIEYRLLPPELNAKLKRYCRSHEATMHQVLLCALQGLLARYSGQEEFILGSTIANRTQPSMEDVVGRFAHPQAILADVHGDPSYRQLLVRVVDWSSKAYAHQDLPFSRLIEEFQLDERGAAAQFLRVYFVYQKAFMQPQDVGGIKITPRPSVSGGVNFDLLISVVERAEGSRLQVEYDTVLFDQQRISRLIAMYIRVLHAVMENDELRVSELPLLSLEEHEQVAAAGTSAFTASAGLDSLLTAFDQRVLECGESPAIIAGDQRTSWQSLHARSLQYAHGLKTLGIQTGDTVALCMEPVADTAAAAIAILRVGAAVLPIPSGTDAAEIKNILEQLQPALSLAAANSSSRLPGFTGLEGLSGHTADLAESPSLPVDAPAWLGVTLDAGGNYHVTTASHQATMQSMNGAAQAIDLQARAAVLVMRAFGSVDSWTDLMLPLTAGASIIYADRSSVHPLQSLLDREQIAFVFGTLAEARHLLDSGWNGDRRVHMVCRGRGGASAGLEPLRNSFGKISVLHIAAATAGPFAFAAAQRAATGGTPLLPLPGQRITILTQAGTVPAFGVPGELGLERNGEFFRTGQLARYSPERGFENCGMVERSIQLNGRHFNLGELEDVVLRAPLVDTVDAALTVNAGARPLLTAYITGRGGKRPSPAAVGAFLKSEAPDYLALAEVIAVESIPRGIDGTAYWPELPGAGEDPQTSPEAPVIIAPRDELETRLVKIWEDVLGIRGISIRDSFFSLGGYSLMIVRLFARMNKVMGTALPITTVFNAPTIEQVADILRGRTVYSPLVPVQTKGTKPPFFLIHSYLIYEGLRSALGEDRPFYGLRELDPDEDMALEDRVGTYIQEIRSVQPTGPYQVAGWCAAGPLAVETARQLAEAGEEVAAVILFDSWRPGYTTELANAADPQMRALAILGRKLRFHRLKLRPLSARLRVKYVFAAVTNKFQSARNKLVVKHWAMAQRIFTAFGVPLPHIMHNGSLKTLESIRDYKGRPFPGQITLIRATDAPYFPHADDACGWSSMAGGGVDVLFAPGTHETMFLEPNLSTMGEMLRGRLETGVAAAVGAVQQQPVRSILPTTEMRTMPSPADLFGCTYVINLPERKDRFKAISHELNDLGMPFTHPKVKLFEAIRCSDPCGFPSAAVRGCFLSHLSILLNARAEGLESVLILEDDLAVSPLFAEHLKRLLQRAARQPWGFIYFGHQETYASSEEPELQPYSGPLVTAHFYAVSASIYDRLIAYLEAVQSRAPGHPEGGPMHYDGALSMFRRANPGILTLLAQPSLGWQRSSRSDIHGRWYDKIIGLRNAVDLARGIRLLTRTAREG